MGGKVKRDTVGKGVNKVRVGSRRDKRGLRTRRKREEGKIREE